MNRKEQLEAAIAARKQYLAEREAKRAKIIFDWEKNHPVEIKFGGNFRLSRLMRKEMQDIFEYSGSNYKLQALSEQYRELTKDNPERARDSRVIRWYVRKWRKL